jgi:hypothetical protein
VLSLAPFGFIGPETRPAIKEHSNGPIPGEPSLEMLVKLRAIACDDHELPNHLCWGVVLFRHRVTAHGMTRRRSVHQEPRERGACRAPAGWARRGANGKALVAIETQSELLQRDMHPHRKHSSTSDCRPVTAGTGTGTSEPGVATVTSVS